MKKKYLWWGLSLNVIIISVLLSLPITPLHGRQLTVERERAVLREGPGSFYDIVAELPIGTSVGKISDEEGWYKVSYQNLEGYLAPRMTVRTPKRNDPLASMEFGAMDTQASQHAMSAGIRGFAERFAETFQGDPSFLELAFTYQMDSRAYRDFKRSTHRGINIRRIRRGVSIPQSDAPSYYTLSEEGLGLGIAARIASIGLYRNPPLHEYINQVGNLVVEASDVYDKTFKFFVLDLENPNAYATPAGIIFITTGMLRLIDNEAELAVVLGHEIAHVARFHGLIELEERRHQIAADDAFAEMDSFFEEQRPDAVSQETRELIEELEDLSFSIYERLIEGRLDDYEEEADLLGMIYVIRAGYNPHGMISLLERMISTNALSNNEHYRPEINQHRIRRMTTNIKRMNVPDDLTSERNRYQRHTRGL